MASLWNWLKNKANRQVLGWIGTGIVAAFSLFVKLYHPEKQERQPVAANPGYAPYSAKAQPVVKQTPHKNNEARHKAAPSAIESQHHGIRQNAKAEDGGAAINISGNDNKISIGNINK